MAFGAHVRSLGAMILLTFGVQLEAIYPLGPLIVRFAGALTTWEATVCLDWGAVSAGPYEEAGVGVHAWRLFFKGTRVRVEKCPCAKRRGTTCLSWAQPRV